MNDQIGKDSLPCIEHRSIQWSWFVASAGMHCYAAHPRTKEIWALCFGMVA